MKTCTWTYSWSFLWDKPCHDTCCNICLVPVSTILICFWKSALSWHVSCTTRSASAHFYISLLHSFEVDVRGLAAFEWRTTMKIMSTHWQAFKLNHTLLKSTATSYLYQISVEMCSTRKSRVIPLVCLVSTSNGVFSCRFFFHPERNTDRWQVLLPPHPLHLTKSSGQERLRTALASEKRHKWKRKRKK